MLKLWQPIKRLLKKKKAIVVEDGKIKIEGREDKEKRDRASLRKWMERHFKYKEAENMSVKYSPLLGCKPSYPGKRVHDKARKKRNKAAKESRRENRKQ